LRLRRIRTVALDASDERGTGLDDVTIEFVIEVAAVNDVQTSRLQHGPQLTSLRATGGGNGGIQGSSAEDVEVQVQLDSSVLGVFPQGPSHARKRTKDTAVHGCEMEQLLSIRPVDNRRGLTGQFLQDSVQGAGVKHPCSLANKGASASKYSRPSMSLGCKSRRRRLAIFASLPSRQSPGTHEGIAQISCQRRAQILCRTLLYPLPQGERAK